jgi:8-oxo-dGTP pyrophosphatase MutT (NUDIX family)
MQLLEQYHTSDVHEAAMLQDMRLFTKRYPLCLERSLSIGHITTSAWITDLSREYILMLHHRKLDKWLQPGGHADGESNLHKAAMKEVVEESGLSRSIAFLSEDIFDVDIHLIPARKQEPAHHHYDIRFMMKADKEEPLTINQESKALRWVHLNEVPALNPDESIIRMLRKHKQLFNI